MVDSYSQQFAFSQQLWFYYIENRRRIRSHYNDLTRKFLAYNDRKRIQKLFETTAVRGSGNVCIYKGIYE